MSHAYIWEKERKKNKLSSLPPSMQGERYTPNSWKENKEKKRAYSLLP